MPPIAEQGKVAPQLVVTGDRLHECARGARNVFCSRVRRWPQLPPPQEVFSKVDVTTRSNAHGTHLFSFLDHPPQDVFSKVDKGGEGVCVQASTLGSLEALLCFLQSPEVSIPVSGINIGPVHKRDVLRANVMNERKVRRGVVVFAFVSPASSGAAIFVMNGRYRAACKPWHCDAFHTGGIR